LCPVLSADETLSAVQVFNLIPNNQTTDIIATFVQSLAPLNSAANPFIFCLFSTNVGKYVRYEK
jgi:hypothetical protein